MPPRKKRIAEPSQQPSEAQPEEEFAGEEETGTSLRRRTKLPMHERDEFSTPVALGKYRELLERKLVIGKVITSEFCDAQGLNVHQMFANIGWGGFVSIKLPQYPKLVKIFYAHLELLDNGLIRSMVKKTPIELPFSGLQRVFRIAQDPEFCYYKGRGWPDWDGFDRVTALRQLCGDPTINRPFKLCATHMTLEARIIHHVVSYNILPRCGGRDNVSYMQMFVTWCVLNGKKVSLPYLMFNHMKYALARKDGALPYCMALTKVFKHFKVPLHAETEIRKVQDADMYTEKLLKLMKFNKTDSGWTLPHQLGGTEVVQMDEDEERGSEDGESENDEDYSDDEEFAYEGGGASSGALLKQVLERVSALTTVVNDGFNEMRGEIRALNERMTSIQSDINELKHSGQG